MMYPYKNSAYSAQDHGKNAQLIRAGSPYTLLCPKVGQRVKAEAVNIRLVSAALAEKIVHHRRGS